MKKILFYTDSDTGLNGEIALFNLMKMRGLEVEPYFCYTNELNIDTICKKNNIEKDDANFISLEFSVGKLLQRFRNKLYMFETLPVISTMAISAHVKEIKVMKSQVSDLFDRISPDYVIPYADRRGGFEEIIIFAAKEKHIPVFVPSLSGMRFSHFFDNPKNGKRFEKGSKLPSVYAKAMQVNPDWFKEHDDHIFCFREATMLLAEYKCGVANLHPWMVGGIATDLSCYFSLDGYYEAVENIGETLRGQIALTSRAEDEFVKFFAEKKDSVLASLREKYDLKAGRIVLLSSNPGEHCGLCDEDYSYEVHKKLVQALAKDDCDVLISLHPKMNLERYSQLAKLADNIKFVTEPLREIVSVADTFVFASWSSVREWATILNIPFIGVPIDYWNIEKKAEFDEYLVDMDSHITREESANAKLQYDFIELFDKIDKGNDTKDLLAKQFDSIMEMKK